VPPRDLSIGRSLAPGSFQRLWRDLVLLDLALLRLEEGLAREEKLVRERERDWMRAYV